MSNDMMVIKSEAMMHIKNIQYTDLSLPNSNMPDLDHNTPIMSSSVSDAEHGIQKAILNVKAHLKHNTTWHHGLSQR
jgi:hypothetical protein